MFVLVVVFVVAAVVVGGFGVTVRTVEVVFEFVVISGSKTILKFVRVLIPSKQFFAKNSATLKQCSHTSVPKHLMYALL